jgi:outer membrane immunogenic protein
MTMKRCIVSCVGVLLVTGLSGATFAADLSAPAPAAFRDWTGCFAGVHAGGTFSDDKILGSSDFTSAGFIGGGQVGCDYQFASAWVVGVEGRAAWSSLNTQTPGLVIFPTVGITVPSHFTVGNDLLASATARLGHTFGPGWLVYARGGAAWTRENSDDAFIRPFTGVAVDPSATTIRTGWTAGAGAEWAFAPHWSTSLEYNYYDFGSNDFTLTDTVNAVTITGNLKDTIQTVTVGLNYRF